jgi:hypothetical protein
MPRSWIAFACVVAAAGAAHAFDNGQYGEVPDDIRSWFKSVRSPNGVPCCDIADGHRTTWDKRTGDDRYWVPIEGEWTPVPPEAVVHDAGNPTGEAVVWYVKMQGNPPVAREDGRERPDGPDQSKKYHIRCFVPGGGV